MKYNATQYYYDGYAAHTNGLAYEQCQIEIGTPARLEWCRGWRDAERDDREKSSTHEIDSCNKQFESLATKEDEGWCGEGLPPVGVTCEHCPGGTTQTEWEIVTVLGISERPDGVFTDYWLRKEDGSTYIIGNPYRFRPIRTEAERRREEVADSLNKLLGDIEKYPTWKDALSGIYDLVASGEVPHLKLEASDE